MPCYPKSKTWPATRKRIKRIIATQHILLTALAPELGMSPRRLGKNITNSNQPHPDIEKRIVEWCGNHENK